MRYSSINNQLFVSNREALKKILPSNSMVILTSNDIMPTNADGVFPFKQNSDLFYFSGIDQDNTYLIIYPDAVSKSNKEILFIQKTDEHMAVWDGEKLNKKEAENRSGIKTIFWIDEFETFLNNLIIQAEKVFFNLDEHARSLRTVKTSTHRLIEKIRNKYPLHKLERLAPFTIQLRMLKSDIEVMLLNKALEITKKGYNSILKTIKPGIKEYELEGEFMKTFIANQSRGFAYTPIIASGKNACILHYIKNNQTCLNGDLILFDVGAEYANYNADITRCFPVSGKFTKRQKEVYNAVLRVLKSAQDMCRIGTIHSEYQKSVEILIEKELCDLGVLKLVDIKKQDVRRPLYKKYFMHGVSHHLGLDVHDVSNPKISFEKDMVLTVEPGIYIREEGIGVRLENDILITENKPNILSNNIPIEIEEIEDLMN